ncbi:coiled-coil domain protein [Trypanosoma theileri]|uniref:Coiled-coil domain protein n=1 Tax=Trypanosoma theileri TaxID=67003 RepID=A0A1X0NRY0_9TRYP|nr:coiled-coil domain protein [Trypanosoma theileri]ORC86939.1 coiled-coil domain protein [Trypanosoma theileri]
MPPKMTPAQRHRSHILASSVEAQEAAIMEWRAKSQEDEKTLRCISSKIKGHKKSVEKTRRGGRWLAEHNSLNREAISCELDFEKAWTSCAALLPEVLSRERDGQEYRYAELLKMLGTPILNLRKQLHSLSQEKGNHIFEDLETMRKELLALRDHFSEAKKMVDAEAEDLLQRQGTEEEGEEMSQEMPLEVFHKEVQSTMDTFESLCAEKCGNEHKDLIETYRTAIETEVENAKSQLLRIKGASTANIFPTGDLRTVSLIMKTFNSVPETGGETSTVSEDLYNNIHQILPHLPRTSLRLVVDEVLRQKRERVQVRSIMLYYRRKISELLESFEKAIAAEEEIVKLQVSIQEESRLRGERQQKTHEELARLRALREERDAIRRNEEEAKRMEEEKKQQEILRIREAEFQERLKRLQLYQEQQKLLQEKERAVQQAAAEEEELKKMMQREHNAKRVEERRLEYEEKCRQRKKHQQEVEELKAAREKNLENFFKGVERRLGVTSDPERVLQGTVSSQQSVPFVSSSQAAKVTVNGYTMNDVMRDPRFRLQIALMEAGLHQTPYGREVMCRGFHVPAAQRPSDENPFRMKY